MELELDEEEGPGQSEQYAAAEASRTGIELAGDERLTWPEISKYEVAMVLGLRARQIMLNSPLYLELADWGQARELSPMELAEAEFVAGTLPFRVRRVHPDGDYEEWGVEEFENRHDAVSLRVPPSAMEEERE